MAEENTFSRMHICYNPHCVEKASFIFSSKEASHHRQHHIEKIYSEGIERKFDEKYGRVQERCRQILQQQVDTRIKQINFRISEILVQNMQKMYQKMYTQAMKEFIDKKEHINIFAMDLYLNLNSGAKNLFQSQMITIQTNIAQQFQEMEKLLAQKIANFTEELKNHKKNELEQKVQVKVYNSIKVKKEKKILKQRAKKEKNKHIIDYQKVSKKEIGSSTNSNQFEIYEQSESRSVINESKPTLSFPKAENNYKKHLKDEFSFLKNSQIIIQSIIFNCYHSRKNVKAFLENLSNQKKKFIKKIEEFWDQHKYFLLKQSNIYFPHAQFIDTRALRHHFSSDQWKNFENLQNIWISHDKNLNEVIKSGNKFTALSSLRLQACVCCKKQSFHPTKALQYFAHIKLLEALVLKYLKFQQNFIETFREVLVRNQKMQCLIMEECFPLEYQIIEPLRMTHLKILVIKGDYMNRHQNYLDVNPVFDISSLQCLTLSNLYFIDRNRSIEEQDKDSSLVISGIFHLTNLTYLNLYQSYPVYSDIFQYLSPLLYLTIKFLIIGNTNINNMAANFFRRFKILKELNIDRLDISITTLFEAYGSPCLSLSKLSAFQFSGKSKIYLHACFPPKQYGIIDSAEIELIGKMFPNLQYLNIAYCRSFLDVSWSKISSLKYLSIDSRELSEQDRCYFKSKGINIFVQEIK